MRTLVFLAAAWTCGGCVFFTPLPDRYQPGSRRQLAPEEMNAVTAGVTTAQDVLLRFGEPTSVAEDDSSFVYEWSYEHGRAVLAWAGYYSGDVWWIPGKLWQGSFVVEFDERRLVSQRSVWLNARTVVADGAPAWMEYDRARTAAGRRGSRGKLIALFVPFSCGRAPCDDPRCASSAAVEAELGEVREDGTRFLAVRADAALAARFGVSRPPAVVMLDWSGVEVVRREDARAGDARSMLSWMMAKSVPRSVAWWSLVALEMRGWPLDRALLVAFTDDTKETEELLAALEEPECGDLHARLTFARCADAAEAKRWNATPTPELVLFDPADGAILGRLSRRATPLVMRLFLLRGLAKFDAARRG